MLQVNGLVTGIITLFLGGIVMIFPKILNFLIVFTSSLSGFGPLLRPFDPIKYDRGIISTPAERR